VLSWELGCCWLVATACDVAKCDANMLGTVSVKFEPGSCILIGVDGDNPPVRFYHINQ